VHHLREHQRRVRLRLVRPGGGATAIQIQYHSPNAITFVAQITALVASSPVALLEKSLLLVRMSRTRCTAADRFAAVMNAITALGRTLRVRPDDKPMTNDQGPTTGTGDQACDLLQPV
jgi:hypothetical protein